MYTQEVWLKESLIKWISKFLHLVKEQIKPDRSHIRMKIEIEVNERKCQAKMNRI
jgi:translation initiation factor 2 alpha subunit (eIF-2alpha)